MENTIKKISDLKLQTTISLELDEETIIMSISQLKYGIHKGKLLLLTQNGMIKIINLITYKSDLTIENTHEDQVNSLNQLNDSRIISSSSDKTIKIFTIEEKEYKLDQTLEGHTYDVFDCKELSNNLLISCSNDGSLILWEKNAADNNYFLKEKIITKPDEISEIEEINDNLILAISVFDSCSQVSFWSLHPTFKLLNTIQDIETSGRSSYFKINDNIIGIVECENLGINIIDINKFEIIKKLKNVTPLDIICNVKWGNNIVFSEGPYFRRDDPENYVREYKIIGENCDNLQLVSEIKMPFNEKEFPSVMIVIDNNLILGFKDLKIYN